MDFHFFRRRLYGSGHWAKGGIPNARYDTSDIAQEAMVQILRDIQEGKATLEKLTSAYLGQVGRGTANRMLRDNLAQKRAMTSETSREHEPTTADEAVPPQEEAIRNERVIAILDAASQLSVNEREVLLLSVIDDCTYAEIARRRGDSPSAVRRLAKSAIQRVRAILRESGFEDVSFGNQKSVPA